MTDPSLPAAQAAPVNSKQGRGVRMALMALPLGTVLLSIASFGIWWFKKQTVEDRTYAYASALRREMTPQAVERFERVAREVLALPTEDRLPSMAAFLESSMGAENMGYQVRETGFTFEPTESSIIDVELTGKQRPRDVVILLTTYGGDLAGAEFDSLGLATLMALAHSVAGEGTVRTLRFAALPDGLTDPRGRDSVTAFADDCRTRDERVTHVWVLGNTALAAIREAFRAESTGCVVQRVPVPETATDAVEEAGPLRSMLFEEANRP